MVKVECHGCGAPYQIDERRIPPAGLKMRCPKCGASLLVMRPGQEPPAAPPPAAPPRPQAAPPKNPTGEWSGVDLPAPAAPRPPAAGFGGGGGFGAAGGFGEIDLSVDPGGGGGEVDLPAVHGPPATGGGGFGALDMGPMGGVDLPATRAPAAAPRPAAPPAPAGPPPALGGFGALDLGVDSGAVDLPATRDPYAGQAPPGHGPDSGVDLPAVAARPAANPFGSAGLPAVFGGAAPPSSAGLPTPAQAQGHAGLPMPAGGGMGLPMPAGGGAGLPMPGRSSAGLPMPAGGGAGLPMPAGGSSGLPMPAGGGAGLPMPAGGGAGLPMPSSGLGLPMPGGGAGLPMPGGGGAGLPMPGGGAGLPMPGGGAGLPMPGGFGAGLPAAGGAGLPMPGGPGLPATGGPGLPTSASTSGLPIVGGPGLPSMSHAGLPVVNAAGLPVNAGGLPAPAGPGLPARSMSTDAFSPTGLGLPTPSGGGLGSPIGGEADFGDPNAGGVNVGSVDLGSIGGGVGGEVELDGSSGGSAGTLFEKKERSKSLMPGADDDAPVTRSRGIKIAAGVMVVVAVAGGLMALSPSLGPFGINAIMDKVNRGKYDAAVGDLRNTVQGAFDEDTLPSAVNAGEQAKAAHNDRERHQDTAAYAAFTLYMKNVRFGRDGGTEITAKSFLDATDRSAGSTPKLLALAAEDTLAGQLARAKQSVDKVLEQTPDDVDANVLSGEIALRSKDTAGATAAFSKAIQIHRSARTLYGLARAQMAGGKTAEAEATAKNVLELSKNHVGARILVATVANLASGRDGEALKLLQEVTKDPAVRPAASQTELVDAFVQLGRVQLNASRITQAQEAYAEALKIDPQSVDALIGSGELFYRSGRFSEAEARFESALRSDADSVLAKLGQAKTWIALERAKEAKDLLAKLQAVAPNEPQVYYQIGRANEVLGQRKDAEQAYRLAIEKAKTAEDGVQAYVALSALLASNNRAADAAQLLTEAANKFPDSGELARARGDIAAKTGRFEEAVAQYEAALKKRSDDLSTRFALGQTLRKMRKYDEAIAVFDEISKIDKEYPGLAIERGLYYEETGQADEAVKMYNEALAKAPGDIDLKLRIGSTQVAAGAAKQAEPLLKEVIRERGNSAEANHFLGRAMLLSGSNLNEAMRYLKRAVELDSNRAEYYLYVGWAANQAGQPALADTNLTKALELDHTLADAYWQRGVMLQNQGRTADAIKSLETALELKQSRYEAYGTLALCFESQNNMTKAEEAWRKAIAGNDKVPDPHYHLGKLLKGKNSDKDAIAEFEKAIELGGQSDPKPGWLPNANFLAGEAIGSTVPEKAVGYLSEYLKSAPLDDAYRSDAQKLIDKLKPMIKPK